MIGFSVRKRMEKPWQRSWRRWLGVVMAAGCFSALQAQTDGAQRWAFTTVATSTEGTIVSSPSAAADGTIYIGLEVGAAASTSPSGKLFAVNPNGAQKWVFTPPTSPDWIDSAPAIAADGTVYVGCWNGMLYAVRPTDGTEHWEFKAGSFIASSPAVGTDGTIYVGAGANLVAVNPDGTLKWSFPAADWIDASPAIGPDGTIYVGSWDNNFYAVNPDGSEKWRFTAYDNISSSAAIAADGTIYFGSRDTAIYALAPDGTLRWSYDTNDTIESSPVLAADGTIYVATTGGQVLALSRDGTLRWQYPAVGQPPLKAIYSTPAVRADGTIVFGSSNDAIYALRADGTLLWRTPLSGTGVEVADSSPLVTHEGTIYLGCSDKKLYSFNSAASAQATDWPQFHRDVRRTGWEPLGSVSGTAGRLINLSVRTFAGADAATLIVGFFVSGSGGRSLLVRGVGPTLANFGVSGTIADPQIAAYSGPTTVIESNNNWDTAPNASAISATAPAVGAFPLPSGSLDAAMLRDFRVGSYTVQVSGASTTGVALMEIYDASGMPGNPAAIPSARLANVSARSAVGTGSGILIAGFAVKENSRAVLIRGVGPALAAFGVSGVLANPQLRIFQGSQPFAENDNWSAASNAAAIASVATSVGAFPLAGGSADAALLLTLPPGSYTAQISGVNNTTGVALVEVYEVP
jgi:outer membrane protein assembly factor BamB